MTVVAFRIVDGAFLPFEQKENECEIHPPLFPDVWLSTSDEEAREESEIDDLSIVNELRCLALFEDSLTDELSEDESEWREQVALKWGDVPPCKPSAPPTKRRGQRKSLTLARLEKEQPDDGSSSTATTNCSTVVEDMSTPRSSDTTAIDVTTLPVSPSPVTKAEVKYEDFVASTKWQATFGGIRTFEHIADQWAAQFYALFLGK